MKQVNKSNKTTTTETKQDVVVPKTDTPTKKPKGGITEQCVNELGGFGGCLTNMPLYSVVATKKGNVILGGGGGESKTGIPNGLVCRNMACGDVICAHCTQTLS